MISLTSPYTAPDYDSINFSLCSGYTAPDYDSINFSLGLDDSCITDSCTYTSGNWEIDCSDNCIIESNVNIGGNNMIFTNSGTFRISADITNYGQLSISSGCDIILEDNIQLISS